MTIFGFTFGLAFLWAIPFILAPILAFLALQARRQRLDVHHHHHHHAPDHRRDPQLARRGPSVGHGGEGRCEGLFGLLPAGAAHG